MDFGECCRDKLPIVRRPSFFIATVAPTARYDTGLQFPSHHICRSSSTLKARYPLRSTAGDRLQRARKLFRSVSLFCPTPQCAITRLIPVLIRHLRSNPSRCNHQILHTKLLPSSSRAPRREALALVTIIVTTVQSSSSGENRCPSWASTPHHHQVPLLQSHRVRNPLFLPVT